MISYIPDIYFLVIIALRTVDTGAGNGWHTQGTLKFQVAELDSNSIRVHEEDVS